MKIRTVQRQRSTTPDSPQPQYAARCMSWQTVARMTCRSVDIVLEMNSYYHFEKTPLNDRTRAAGTARLRHRIGSGQGGKTIAYDDLELRLLDGNSGLAAEAG